MISKIIDAMARGVLMPNAYAIKFTKRRYDFTNSASLLERLLEASFFSASSSGLFGSQAHFCQAAPAPKAEAGSQCGKSWKSGSPLDNLNVTEPKLKILRLSRNQESSRDPMVYPDFPQLRPEIPVISQL